MSGLGASCWSMITILLLYVFGGVCEWPVGDSLYYRVVFVHVLE